MTTTGQHNRQHGRGHTPNTPHTTANPDKMSDAQALLSVEGKRRQSSPVIFTHVPRLRQHKSPGLSPWRPLKEGSERKDVEPQKNESNASRKSTFTLLSLQNFQQNHPRKRYFITQLVNRADQFHSKVDGLTHQTFNILTHLFSRAFSLIDSNKTSEFQRQGCLC